MLHCDADFYQSPLLWEYDHKGVVRMPSKKVGDSTNLLWAIGRGNLLREIEIQKLNWLKNSFCLFCFMMFGSGCTCMPLFVDIASG